MIKKTSKSKIKPFVKWDDIVREDFKKNPQEAYEYLLAALKQYEVDHDERFLLLALRRVAEAVGVINIAEKTGLTRQSIYKALSAKGNPTLKTLDAILRALGFTHNFRPI